MKINAVAITILCVVPLFAQNQININSWSGTDGSNGTINLGDLTGDGKTDVFMWKDAIKSWSVNISTGTGFSSQTWTNAYGTTVPLYTGDLNGDKKKDVFFWDNMEKVWRVNLSTGTTFLSKPWSGAWGSDGLINVGDLNGDGKDDVFMWRDGGKDWTVNISTGTGFNTQIWHGAWGSDGQIHVGDLNGDAKDDVFMWNNSMRNWSVNLSTGTGFDAQAWNGAPGSEGEIHIGDLNGDKLIDAFMWSVGDVWLVNLSTGTGFNSAQWKGISKQKSKSQTGDFNGDGKTDVVTWIENIKQWKINFSTGTGFKTESFTVPTDFDNPINICDLNGDAKSDFLIWNNSDKSWNVHISSFSQNSGYVNPSTFENGLKEINKAVPDIGKKQKTAVSKNTESNPVNQQNSQFPLNAVSASTKSQEQRIADLEARIANLEYKTPYYSMDVITITTDANNLFESTDIHLGYRKGEIKIYDRIRIDHPLSNNNPKAKIFFSYEENGTVKNNNYGHHFNYSEDGFWYIRFSGLRTRQPEPFKITHIYNSLDSDSEVWGKLTSCDWNQVYQYGGISVTQLVSLEPGDKYSFLIFIKDPTLEQSVRERYIKTNQ